MHLVILPLAALLAAALSGMLGMGGGTLLLATLFCFMSHAEAIPAHATVQLASNSTRTLAFLGDVDWRTVGRFAAGLAPGSLGGILLLRGLGPPESSEPYLKALVGAYILASLVIPRPRSGTQAKGKWWDFTLLGLAAGLAAFTVGAVGPLIAPLFARRGFVKERLVATKALCQSCVHVAKIPGFLAARSYPNLSELAAVTLIMAAVSIPGTLIGKRMLRHLSDRGFVALYRLALLVAGVKVLVVDGLLPIWRA